MKKIIVASVFVLVALSQTVTAAPGPIPTPDGGSSLLLIGIASVGIVAARRFLGSGK